VGCAADLQPYSLKTMKSLLNSRYSPLPAYVPEPDPDSSSDQANSSIVTPADQSRPAVDDGGILRSAERSRPTGDPKDSPASSSDAVASSIVSPGDPCDPGDDSVILRSAERSRSTGDLLSSVSSHIRRFLVCDDHQLTILTLWCLYTWCYDCFPTASYLDVSSPSPQCGKTRCLTILWELCNQPDLIASADSRTAMHRLLKPCRTVQQIADDKMTGPYTFLFDDCHLALNTSERQPLLALLKSGTGGSSYSVLSDNYMVFGPKAFAAGAPLPRSLAARCIPIMLRRKKASDKVNFFGVGRHEAGVNDPDDTINPSQLKSSLERWALDKDNRDAIAWAFDAPITDVLPNGLSPAQQNCAEPLLRLAHCIGGDWPQKARAAVAVLFDVPQFDPGLQILYDIRLCFFFKEDPPYLSTRDILAWFARLEGRQWTARAWNPTSGRQLGALLYPFDIGSRNFHPEPRKVFKGYRRCDFEDAWDRYLPPMPPPPVVSLGPNNDVICSASNPSATDPLHPNSSEINAPSGVAE